jgi:glycosyltransferase involved in cell wall biosynthesis
MVADTTSSIDVVAGRMKRVLVVHQHRSPGSYQDRSRGAIYEPSFRAAGFEVRFVGRHPYPFVPRTRLGTALGRSLAVKAVERLRDRAFTPISDARIRNMARHFDAIILIKVDSPNLVRSLRRTGARLVYDLCDQVWKDGRGKIRQDVLAMFGSVDAITVNSGSALEFAQQFGPPVHMWPEAAYIEAFDALRHKSPRDRDGTVVIGWIGSPSTVPNLWLVLEALEEVGRRHPEVRLRLVGVPPNHDILRRFEDIRVSSRSSYDQESMVDEVLGMDIGLYPMFDIEESRVHGLGKALIYMAGGAVVVGSPVRDRKHLIEQGETGFLADGRKEWTETLHRLVTDAKLRARVRDAALKQVRATNSLERSFEALRPLLAGSP